MSIIDKVMLNLIDGPTMLAWKLKDRIVAPSSKTLNSRLYNSSGDYTTAYALRKGACIDKESAHPVHKAIRYNWTHALETLREKGLDFNKPYDATDGYSVCRTPLEEAVIEGDIRMVRLLIDKYGASPHFPAPGQLRELALEEGYQDIHDLLAEKEKDFPLPGAPVLAAQPQAAVTPDFAAALRKPVPASAFGKPLKLRRPAARTDGPGQLS